MTIAECIIQFEYLLGEAASWKPRFALGSRTKFDFNRLRAAMKTIVERCGSYYDHDGDLQKEEFHCGKGICQTLVTVLKFPLDVTFQY